MSSLSATYSVVTRRGQHWLHREVPRGYSVVTARPRPLRGGYSPRRRRRHLSDVTGYTTRSRRGPAHAAAAPSTTRAPPRRRRGHFSTSPSAATRWPPRCCGLGWAMPSGHRRGPRLHGRARIQSAARHQTASRNRRALRATCSRRVNATYLLESLGPSSAQPVSARAARSATVRRRRVSVRVCVV